MAQNLSIYVNPNFNLYEFCNRLAELYRAKGYNASVINVGASIMINFEKNTGGINMLLGMGESIKATCSVINGMLTIVYTNAEWTSKIIGLAVGWFLCLVPFITAIIGCINQSNLPKNISNDATMLISGM